MRATHRITAINPTDKRTTRQSYEGRRRDDSGGGTPRAYDSVERMLKASAQVLPEASTKGRIIRAALQTLIEEGFAGASARAIARVGGFNQALIFYHFGTLNDLLLAALDDTGARRLVRYRQAFEGAESAEDKIAVAAALYREDLDSGHITVLSELIAGSLTRPDLGPEVVARMEPWVEFAQEAIKEVISGTALEEIVPVRTAAFALVALYLGIDLLSHLEEDPARAEDLFEAARGLAKLAAPLLESTS
jgi:AcrR family transcriptional regulator